MPNENLGTTEISTRCGVSKESSCKPMHLKIYNITCLTVCSDHRPGYWSGAFRLDDGPTPAKNIYEHSIHSLYLY